MMMAGPYKYDVKTQPDFVNDQPRDPAVSISSSGLRVHRWTEAKRILAFMFS